MEKQMIQPVEFRPNMYWIGVDDHTTDLFEGLWSIEKEGVSYNSYLIEDEKNVIIDLAKELTLDVYLNQIKSRIDISKIDYIVINHVEPDHAGVVSQIHSLAPGATILCTERARKMLISFYGIVDGIRAVEDGECISLGKHSLKFIYTPNVHWPETMMTYEQSQQILFSCDVFGGYQTLDGVIFDDECPDLEKYIQQALRYYANIIANHSHSARKALAKLAEIPIQVVAPSHGLIWRKNPEKIIQLNQTWADYGENGGETRITAIHGSMYGNTNLMLAEVIKGIQDVGVPLTVMDVARTQISYILPEMWCSSGILVAAPTYEAALFPPMTNVLEMAVQKKIFNKKTARIGSYGWAGGANRTFEALLCDLRWKEVDTLEFVGVPKLNELNRGRDFGIRFANAVKNQTEVS
jgi:anaerobic nitric oxide reductase flavorubredoxin